ncbi:SOSS complex subunit C-like [Physella acuta]|uniref:SOSS complex subunit C-like n=1 Tax=Physella acuta TaxID=109671 RepID=UPI0027DD2DAB|nr:SOSS complex subunit C-like [Physella acuta]
MSLSHTPAAVVGVGNQNQERQNRKILEHLKEQKKRLQHGQNSSSISVPPVPILTSTPAMVPAGLSASEYAQQRTALQHAHANSVGYFITQDSAFGNLILPVLPRMPEVKPEVK